MKAPKVRVCKYCGVEFVVLNGNQTYCCDEHRIKWYEENKVMREYRAPDKSAKIARKAAEVELGRDEVRVFTSICLGLSEFSPAVSLRGRPGFSDLCRQYGGVPA